MTMRWVFRYGAICLGVAMLTACAARHTPTPKSTASAPPLLIESRGITMPLAQALQKADLHPQIPPGEILAFAVIPPLGGADTPERRGIAIEYRVGEARLLLSEWPRHGYDFSIGTHDIAGAPCTLLWYAPTEVMWATRRNTVMTLAPDGRMRRRVVAAQARRLLRGCGATPSSSTPRPAASSHRRSTV